MKKSTGSFYTPQDLAVLIANETLNRWLARRGGILNSDVSNLSELDQALQMRLLELVKDIRILDPAVGGGAFLLAAADWLNTVRFALGDVLTAPEKRYDIVKNSLYGVDLVNLAVDTCKRNLVTWSNQEVAKEPILKARDLTRIRQGNSLVGVVEGADSANHASKEAVDDAAAFDWPTEFSEVMHSEEPGFDVILGNPPYGNLLNTCERQHIQTTYPFNVGGGRDGSWNCAAHFIVRSRALMKNGGHLGLLVPNSILRVNQFSKTRRFLLDEMCLWKIVDEGSPFEGVTLEMVSLFCEATNDCLHTQIEIESRRPGHEQSNRVEVEALRGSRIFSIYHDPLFSMILRKGKRNMLTANRGRDIPKEHVSDVRTNEFKIPYITSGRSVGRYRIDTRRQIYTDNWFRRDKRLTESFENRFLVATKNLRYPRCVMKPTGVIHGGGIVRIAPSNGGIDGEVVGLILNSRLVQYICMRYLTNYSQLTTCLNTGIMDDLPLVIPARPNVYATLFDALTNLYAHADDAWFENCRNNFERLVDAIVYELYFCKDHGLEESLATTLPERFDSIALCNLLKERRIANRVGDIMKMPAVKQIEERLDATKEAPLRY